MGWPPKVGEILPRAEEATGIREKLLGYSLKLDHEEGGPKAKGFQLILGISIESAGHLEQEICRGIRENPIYAMRPNPRHGINCVVEFPLSGVGARRSVIVTIRTVWLLADSDSPPRLVSALLKP